MHTVLEAIATGNPPHSRTQAEAAAFMENIETLPEAVRRRVRAIYDRSGIDRRFSCIPDYGCEDASDFSFFPPTWTLEPAPPTSQRNRQYREAVLPLAEGVGRGALEAAGRSPGEITHVVAVSCTGFFAPGLDIELVKRLDLPAQTQRTVVGFMGCYAAFNALRVAHSVCQSRPDACVLIVCAELCTLHFQVDDSLESAVVNALFSDGAAAAVLSAQDDEGARGRLTYVTGQCMLDDDSMDHMTWDVGDTGFLMGLSPRVPDVIARHLPDYLEGLLGGHSLTQDDVDFWAIHPGGRAIVEKAQDVLSLSDDAVQDSLEVLRQYGNMSSPTILFVLKRFLDRLEEDDLETGVAMAFGPGLTLEGALWQKVQGVS